MNLFLVNSKQRRKKIVAPRLAEKTEISPTIKAGEINSILVSKKPKNVKRGYPGGCATPITDAAVTKSPTSPP